MPESLICHRRIRMLRYCRTDKVALRPDRALALAPTFMRPVTWRPWAGCVLKVVLPRPASAEPARRVRRSGLWGTRSCDRRRHHRLDRSAGGQEPM